MNILQGIILGLVQGLGEFLPISSSGHLMLTRMLMGVQSDLPAFKIFDILLHVGTLVPVLIVFWKDWIAMIAHPIRNRTLILLFVASLPALGFYLLFDIDVFDNGCFLGISFLITSVLLLATEKLSQIKKKTSDKPGFINAIAMGLMQGLGLLPGVSRSGSTIFGGVSSGLDRKAAAKFSFMMSAPAILGSLLAEGKHALEENLFQALDLVPTVCGVVLAAISGYLAIRFMLKLIQRISLNWFALYMAVIGLLYLLAQIYGFGSFPALQLPAAI